jgi:hypothetical protein
MGRHPENSESVRCRIQPHDQKEANVTRRRKAWEPDWETLVDRAYLRDLVAVLDDVFLAAGFFRSGIYRLSVARPDDPNDLLDGIAAWERHTEESNGRHTFNGASVYGNGLVRISLDEDRGLTLFAGDRTPVEHFAAVVAEFIVISDDECATVVVQG